MEYLTFAAPSSVAPVIKNEFVEIPCNQNSISSDAFRARGKMDKECNSYAAVLMPATTLHKGVEYRIGEPDVNNALKCSKPTTIDLPQGNYNKVCVLAASSDGDRKAVFTVGGKSYGVSVPYYSGFVAEWAWADKTKSFVRDGVPAYIGNHRHKMNGQNDSYVFTYLYAIELDITPGARRLELPKDDRITVFAVAPPRSCCMGLRAACATPAPVSILRL